MRISGKAVRAIASATSAELLRGRVLYNAGLLSLALVAAAWAAAQLSYARPDRLVVDFGLSALHLSCAAIAVLLGAGMLQRERERKTDQLLLSRPISFLDFALGKTLGLARVLALNWLILGALVAGLVAASGTLFGGQGVTLAFLAATWLVLLEALCLAALAVCLASAVGSQLAVMGVAALWGAGSSVSQMRWLAVRMGDGPGKAVVDGVSRVLPDFEVFQLGTAVTYGLDVPLKGVAFATFYAAALVAIATGVGAWILSRRYR